MTAAATASINGVRATGPETTTHAARGAPGSSIRGKYRCSPIRSLPDSSRRMAAQASSSLTETCIKLGDIASPTMIGRPPSTTGDREFGVVLVRAMVALAWTGFRARLSDPKILPSWEGKGLGLRGYHRDPMARCSVDWRQRTSRFVRERVGRAQFLRPFLKHLTAIKRVTHPLRLGWLCGNSCQSDGEG